MEVSVNTYTEVGETPNVRKFYPNRTDKFGRNVIPVYSVSPNEALLLYKAGRLRKGSLIAVRRAIKENTLFSHGKINVGEAEIVGTMKSENAGVEKVNQANLAGSAKILNEMDDAGLKLQAQKGGGPEVPVPTQEGPANEQPIITKVVTEEETE